MKHFTPYTLAKLGACPSAPVLSTREREILEVGELDRADTAVALGMAIRTVDTHRGNIKRKLHAHNWTDAVLQWDRQQRIGGGENIQ